MLTYSTSRIEADIKDSFSIRKLDDTSVQGTCRLAYHRILFVKTGEGSLQIDDNTYAVAGNQIYLLSKGQLYVPDQNIRLTGFELSFGDCFWEKTPASANNCKAVLFNNAADNQCLSLEEKDITDLEPLFLALHGEFEQTAYINKLDAMAAFLKIILIKIANINAALSKGFDNYEKQLYRKFVELVSQEFQSLHEVSAYAQRLNVTPKRLSELCRRCSGKGAKDIINGQLVAEAKRNLQFSSIAIKEIAYQLNFATPEQFSHFFKKNVQASPSDYRSYFIGIGS